MRETKNTHILNIASRWFVGLVFIFSGFVKGIDPLGTSFKIQEYMTAWNIGGLTFEWALPMATFLAVCLITYEFFVGIMLLTNSLRRLTAWMLALIMLFFTTTTLFDAITNQVSDCGCFGDFVKLTNWQTFWKNIVLLVPTVIIFIQRRNLWSHKRRLEQETLIGLLAIAAMIIFSLWNIKNEPCIDVRPWKVGNQMMPFDKNLETQSYVTYKNKQTGEQMEFESKKLMDYYQDTAWRETWEFVSSRVVDPYEIKADGFSMLGPDKDDYATDIIGSPGYVLIGSIHHLNQVDKNGARALQQIHTFCVSHDINFVLLTSATDEDVQNFLYKYDLDELIYYFADSKAIETMMRSNPGFILLKNAKVLGKWNYRKAKKVMQYPFEK